MASRFGFAGGIPERRVRPIWDAVDSRQFKTALKLSVALFAKYPNSPYALALKALILERMGKSDEALSVCLNAKELLYSDTAVHIDELTLSTLQMVFQRLDRLDLATSSYEHACGKYPNNLEIMIGLFNCYVREYSYVKQQQTAIKMYKVVGEERFLLWAICSIQLQVSFSSGGEKLLALAEALLKKHISLHSLHEPEALIIYISILEQQGKYADAFKVLSGDLGSLIGIEVDRLRMQGRLVARSHDYSTAAAIYEKVLQKCPDDWEAFLHYLHCLLEDDIYWFKGGPADQFLAPNAIGFQACNSVNLNEDVFDSRMSSACSFVQKLQMEACDDSVRCPYIASIEIERWRYVNGKVNDGKLVEMLLAYFRRFSHLPCFASDVEAFLHVVTHDQKIELLDAIMKASQATFLPPLRRLGQEITVFKIQEALGSTFNLSLGELEELAVNMVGMYCDNLALSRDLDPQENMHGEELLTMASNVLVQLYWRTSNFGYLLEATLVLEFGLTIRRYIWMYKIYLVHLYSYIGALPLAHEWFGTLGVKNILLETVTHHILPQLLRSPLLTKAADLLGEYLNFMYDYFREAADLTFLAYRHRNYSKVIEFVQFKERLQHSCQFLISRIDLAIIKLKQKSDNFEEAEQSALESFGCGTQLLELYDEEKLRLLTFNEDFQTRPWWSPSPNINFLDEPYTEGSAELRVKLYKDQAKDTEDVARKAIELKSLVPRLVYLSIQTSSYSLDKEPVESNGSLIDHDCCLEFKCLLERYAKNVSPSLDDAMEVILGMSNGDKSLKDYGSDVALWLNLAIFLNAWNVCSNHQEVPSRHWKISWSVVNNLIEKCITLQLVNVQPIMTCPINKILALVELITESFSWYILIIQSFVRSMHPPGKKKKKGATDLPSLPQLQAVRDSIHCLSSNIQRVQKLLDKLERPDDEWLDTLLWHIHARENPGPGKILQILDKTASSGSHGLGDRIYGALQSWNSADVVRKIIAARCKLITEFQHICNTKCAVLESLKQSI